MPLLVIHSSCPSPPQDESTGEITFYMKGADVVMAGIVQYNDWLEEEVRGTRAVKTGLGRVFWGQSLAWDNRLGPRIHFLWLC